MKTSDQGAHNSIHPGFPFWHPGQHWLYIQVPLLEPFLSLSPSRTTPAAQEGTNSVFLPPFQRRNGLVRLGQTCAKSAWQNVRPNGSRRKVYFRPDCPITRYPQPRGPCARIAPTMSARGGTSASSRPIWQVWMRGRPEPLYPLACGALAAFAFAFNRSEERRVG